MRALNEIVGTAWWDAIGRDVERLYEAVRMSKESKAEKDSAQKIEYERKD